MGFKGRIDLKFVTLKEHGVMRREESVFQIVAGIQAVLSGAGFISNAFERSDNPSSPSQMEYSAKITSERIVTRLTTKLFSRVFKTPEATQAFNVSTSRSDTVFLVTIYFRAAYRWDFSDFNHDQLEANVNTLGDSELHVRNAYHLIVRERSGKLALLGKQESDLMQKEMRLASEPVVNCVSPDLKKVRRASTPMVLCERRQARAVDVVAAVVEEKKVRRPSPSRSFLKRSEDNLQPCQRFFRSPSPLKQKSPPKHTKTGALLVVPTLLLPR